MKKIILLFTALTLVFTSCNKDDDSENTSSLEGTSSLEDTSSFVKIAGNQKELKYGIAEDYGIDSPPGDVNVYNIDLTFLTAEFTVNGSSCEGEGLGVYFEVFIYA